MSQSQKKKIGKQKCLLWFCYSTQELALTPKSKSHDVWRKPPMDLNFDVYLFNWTNPCNFTTEQYQKPILQQVGPFRFKESPEKFNIRWHPKNSTVSYHKRSRYHFDEAGSKASLDDEITALNVIALVCTKHKKLIHFWFGETVWLYIIYLLFLCCWQSAAAKALHWPYVKQKKVSMGLTLYGEKTYIVKPARELLFEGYQSDLIDMARDLASFEDETLEIPYDRFGWFYQVCTYI